MQDVRFADELGWSLHPEEWHCLYKKPQRRWNLRALTQLPRELWL